jgi:CheY-like chemotaxis protein
MELPVRARRVLVVDDEPLVAIEIAGILAEAGYEVLGPAATLPAAEALIVRKGCDLALLDVNLSGEPVDEFAATLADRKIPFALVTGYARDDLPQAFRGVPIISKPFRRDHIIEVLDRLAAQRSR